MSNDDNVLQSDSASASSAEPDRQLESCSTGAESKQTPADVQPNNSESHELAPAVKQPLRSKSEAAQTRAMADGHPHLLADAAYITLAVNLLPDHEELVKPALDATSAFRQRMAPKDALEELALDLAVMTHGRAMWLTDLAAKQQDVQSVSLLNKEADRASGTLLRIMRAIDQHHQPVVANTTVSIGQANVAQQQIVQNVKEAREKNAGERAGNQPTRKAAGAKALPADTEGKGVVAGDNLPDTSVDSEPGT